MGTPVTIKIQRDRKIIKTTLATDYNISVDSMSSTTSTFTVDALDLDIKPFDYIIVELMGDPYGIHRTEANFITNDTGTTKTNVTVPLYFGRVISYELTTITAMDAVSAICDQKVVERSFKGANPSVYLYNVYRDFGSSINGPIPDQLYWNFGVREPATGSTWTRTIQDADSVNLTDLIRNMQQYYQHTLTYGGFTVLPSGYLCHNFMFHNLLNDIYSNDKFTRMTIDLNNSRKYKPSSINIYVRPNVNSGVNVVKLIEKNKPTQYLNNTPTTVYMNDDGTFLVNNANPSKFTQYPIIETVVYEPHEDPKHVWANDEYISMAKQVTSIDKYAHTVDFEINLNELDNGRLDKRYTTLGMPITTIYKGQKLDSYISAYSFDSSDDTLHITCGNVRSDLPTYLK